MGWKGTVRSLQASARRSERNAHRRQRELEKRQKEYAKMEALEQAAYEVEVYENHIDVLLSMHKECAEPVKWKRLLSNPEPRQPLKSNTLEQEATHAAATHHPNFWARLFKLEARQRVALVARLAPRRRKTRGNIRLSLLNGKLPIPSGQGRGTLRSVSLMVTVRPS